MADAVEHFGLFNDSTTYTHQVVAEKIGKDDRWVVREMIRKGLRARKVGRTWFITGYHIRLWIEEGAELWSDEDDESQSHDD